MKAIAVYVVRIEIIHEIYAQFAWIIIMHYYYCSSNDAHNVPGPRKKNLFTLRNRSERTNEKKKQRRKKAKQTTGKRAGSANALNVEF